MSNKISETERKQIENEMIFRRINEKVGIDLDALDAMYRKDGSPQFLHDDNVLISFKCECSDENCEVRIPLRLSKYREIHKDRNTFIVKTNHQIDLIEKVIFEEEGYNVVKKNNSTPEPGDTLNRTGVEESSKQSTES